MRMLVQQDSTRVFIVLCQLPVNFCFGSKGMIMSCFKDGWIPCVCSISWMEMNPGGTHEPCHYVSPGLSFILI